MPLTSKDIEAQSYLRLLVLGAAKVGKSTTVIKTAPKPIYVINSDDKLSLRPAARHTSEFEWDYAPGSDPKDIENCIHTARKGVKEGRYKTIVWDTLSEYCRRSLDVYEDATRNAAGESDGRRFWPMHRKHIVGIVDRLLMLKAHLVINVHFYEESEVAIQGQLKKRGQGILPRLPGQLREVVPAMMQDVVFLEKRTGKRSFITSSDGVFGPGCRSLDGVESCAADVGELWGLMKRGGKT